jgi:hypothetical protein
MRDARIARPRDKAALGELVAGDGPGEIGEDRPVAVSAGNAREVGDDHAVI